MCRHHRFSCNPRRFCLLLILQSVRIRPANFPFSLLVLPHKKQGQGKGPKVAYVEAMSGSICPLSILRQSPTCQSAMFPLETEWCYMGTRAPSPCFPGSVLEPSSRGNSTLARQRLCKCLRWYSIRLFPVTLSSSATSFIVVKCSHPRHVVCQLLSTTS